MKKPFIYIMSAYTFGDKAINARFQCEVFNQMMEDGIVLPYAPLALHYQNAIFPRAATDWVQYELDILPRFDAGVRLDVTYIGGGLEYHQSESEGADVEEVECERLGLPVFRSVHALYTWARQWRIEQE